MQSRVAVRADPCASSAFCRAELEAMQKQLDKRALGTKSRQRLRPMCAQSQSLVPLQHLSTHSVSHGTDDFAFHALELNHLIQSDIWHEKSLPSPLVMARNSK